MTLKISVAALSGVLALALSSCGFEQERKPVLPGSDESVLPWNGLQEGEGQGQFGAFQQ